MGVGVTQRKPRAHGTHALVAVDAVVKHTDVVTVDVDVQTRVGKQLGKRTRIGFDSKDMLCE